MRHHDHPRTLAAALVAVAVAPAALRAQAPELWNRRVEAVAVKPIEGDRLGRYGVQPFFSVKAELTTAPLDLSTDVLILVNGSTVAQLHFGITTDPSAAGGCGTACHEQGKVCVCWQGTPICACETILLCDPPTAVGLAVGDEITVILRPAPGALPDAEDRDDGFALRFNGRPIAWDRRIASVDLTPSRTAPDRAVDVHVVLDALANYEGELDLDADVAVLVNGRPASTGHSASDAITWVSCGLSCSGAACSRYADGPGHCVQEPNEGGTTCWCASESYGFADIPGVAAVAGDEITVILFAAPGSVPDTMGEESADRRRVVVPGRALSSFRRGDANASGVVDLGDAVFSLAWQFTGARAPECLDAADVNDDGVIDIGDPIGLLNWLFLGGQAPRQPGPSRCGEDPTADRLGDCVQRSCAGET